MAARDNFTAAVIKTEQGYMVQIKMGANLIYLPCEDEGHAMKSVMALNNQNRRLSDHLRITSQVLDAYAEVSYAGTEMDFITALVKVYKEATTINAIS